MTGVNMSTDASGIERAEEARVVIGQDVRVGEGPLEGFEGLVVDVRPSGRYLVRMHQGVYIETDRVRVCTSQKSQS